MAELRRPVEATGAARRDHVLPRDRHPAAQQHRFRHARRARHHVGAVVHAVGEVHVEPPTLPPHRLEARRPPSAVGVGGRVADAEVGFDLRDPDRRGSLRQAPDEQLPEEVAGHHAGRALVESPSQGLEFRQLRAGERRCHDRSHGLRHRRRRFHRLPRGRRAAGAGPPRRDCRRPLLRAQGEPSPPRPSSTSSTSAPREAAALIADAGVEVLVHHAAQMDVRRSVGRPGQRRRHQHPRHVEPARGRAEAALRQVVFASTGGAMYGEQDALPGRRDAPGAAALAVRRGQARGRALPLLLSRGVRRSTRCLRYANVYGPRQNPHGEAGVVAIFLDRLLSGAGADDQRRRAADPRLRLRRRRRRRRPRRPRARRLRGLQRRNRARNHGRRALHRLAAAVGVDRPPATGRPRRASSAARDRLRPARRRARPPAPGSARGRPRATAAWFAARAGQARPPKG